MITPAYAQTGAPTEMITNFLIPMALVFGIFYVLVFRPQQSRVKEHQARVNAVRRGDVVVTAGGIIGKVTRVGTDKDNEVRVEIADGVQVRVLRSTITEVRGKGEPFREKLKPDTAADNDDAPTAKPGSTT